MHVAEAQISTRLKASDIKLDLDLEGVYCSIHRDHSHIIE